MTVSAITPVEKLPVPVLEYPHWRVNYRPSEYVPNRLESHECLEVVRKARVRLRGWDFPHVSSDSSELGYGDSWVAAWSNFMGHLEYWRFYQSTQFLYLGSVREVTETDWIPKLRHSMRDHGMRADSAPGFLSLRNSIYNITEFFEFAARLAQAQIYAEPVTVSISLTGVKDFMLAEENRVWSGHYVARQGQMKYERTLTPTDLIATAADKAIECCVWLFEHFGWSKPNVDVIRTEQQRLLTRTA